MVAHQVGGLNVGVGLRDRKLNALIGADGPPEDHPVARIRGGPLSKPVPVADGFGGNQNPLRVPAVDNVAEAHALLADKAIGWDLDIVEEDRVGVMVDHQVEWLDFEFSLHAAHIHQKHGKSLCLIFQFFVGRGARHQQHQVGLLDARDENLLAVDHVAVAFALGAGFEPRGIRAGIRLRDGKCLQPQFALGDGWQVAAFLFIAAVPQHCAHGVHLGMAGAGVAAGVIDLFENDAGLGDAQARPAILFRNQRGEIAALREGRDKLLGVAFFLVHGAPVWIGKIFAEAANRLADGLAIFAGWWAGVCFHLLSFGARP